MYACIGLENQEKHDLGCDLIISFGSPNHVFLKKVSKFLLGLLKYIFPCDMINGRLKIVKCSVPFPFHDT